MLHLIFPFRIEPKNWKRDTRILIGIWIGIFIPQIVCFCFFSINPHQFRALNIMNSNQEQNIESTFASAFHWYPQNMSYIYYIDVYVFADFTMLHRDDFVRYPMLLTIPFWQPLPYFHTLLFFYTLFWLKYNWKSVLRQISFLSLSHTLVLYIIHV